MAWRFVRLRVPIRTKHFLNGLPLIIHGVMVFTAAGNRGREGSGRCGSWLRSRAVFLHHDW
jgi:hypothetical protein